MDAESSKYHTDVVMTALKLPKGSQEELISQWEKQAAFFRKKSMTYDFPRPEREACATMAEWITNTVNVLKNQIYGNEENDKPT
jgi:hypothetical protein